MTNEEIIIMQECKKHTTCFDCPYCASCSSDFLGPDIEEELIR